MLVFDFAEEVMMSRVEDVDAAGLLEKICGDGDKEDDEVEVEVEDGGVEVVVVVVISLV